MESESALEPSSKQDIHDYVDGSDANLDENIIEALGEVEESRYFIEDDDRSFSEGYEVVDAVNRTAQAFPNLESAIDTITTSYLYESSGKHGKFETGDSLVVYDRDVPDAWIESDVTFNVQQ